MKCFRKNRILRCIFYNEISVWFSYIISRLYRSDINEHLGTLYKYAINCSHITELGTRTCVSTRSFLLGLIHTNFLRPKVLVCVDLERLPETEYIENACDYHRINYHFYEMNDLEIELERTDLLFIDTWHVYGQLKRELEKHHSKVRKYIILHDTTIDAITSESIRMKHNIGEKMKESGFKYEEITRGIWPAVEEFLIKHPEFYLREKFTNNNGLTILERKLK